MRSRWRRFNLALGARIAASLFLIIALLYPAPQSLDKDVHVVVLVESSRGINSDAIRDRIVKDTGQTRHLSIHPTVNDIDSALHDALWEIEPTEQGVLIIVSQGRWTGDTLRTLTLAKNAGVEVFWQPLLPDESTSGILRILAPGIARAGQEIGVSVDVKLAASEQAEIVLLANDRPVETRMVAATGQVSFVATVPDSGPLVIGAELREANTGRVIASLNQGFLTNVANTPSILIVSGRGSVFGQSLREGGWPVSELLPAELDGQLEDLGSFACLVLDDIAAGDLSAMAWTRIAKAVRQDALGLLVLGGPHSFGLGAYRDSQLESLLPVISEPPKDEPPTSLVFLIDVSGSMDRAGTVGNRLQIAKQASVETAKSLRSVDRVGLMTFDVRSRELLSLISRTNHAEAIERVWPEAASGGTLLIESLERAIAALEQDDSQQKMLVLLTDGFLADDDLGQLDKILGNSEVELIAMIIGDNQPSGVSALSRITDANNGRVIQVDDVLRLPTLMRSEVESRRPALLTGRTQPKVMSPTSWLRGDVAWPTIDAYLLTRPREEAQIHLLSARGDVIIASMPAGAGKVAAVTSGFGGWTDDWLQSSHWPEFAAGLTGFLAARDTNKINIAVVQNSRDKARLSVQLLDNDLLNNLNATLVSPSGAIGSIDLQPESPGVLTADLDLSSDGQYTVVVSAGTITTRYRFLRQAIYNKQNTESPIANTWLNDGVVALWDERALQFRNTGNVGRNLFMGLALLIFLSTLLFERGSPVWKYLRNL